ncbi:spore germination protein KA [Evansella caseinilytica]|uniref:Spore germination protein KA n=1 Tax=Evansella caseinilytica TaxID=1503961 RepID=A0A1H3H146_9BACI|nr:spore germination protein [Evansella caseinilytica]SDY09242.1 spore germination protein KA [Evansella caseinilytica]
MTSSNEAANRLEWFQEQFKSSEDIVYHQFTLPSDISCALIYIKGMVNLELIHNHLLAPLINNKDMETTLDELLQKIAYQKKISVSGYSVTRDLNKAKLELLDGNTILLMDNEEKMAVFPLIDYEVRAISESTNESVIRGPRESFVEDMQINITMIRRKIKSEKLAIESFRFGELTQTKTSILYIDGICEKKLIDEIKSRLQRVEIDGIFDPGYLEDFLEDSPFSIFPQLESTEKPDVVSACLLDGRAVIMTDGSPNCIIAPVTFFMLMQSAEDYYHRHFIGTWVRWIRLFSLATALLLPSLYIAVTTFHPEMVPTNLILTISAARDIVPFPGILEAMMLELTFEVLREASVRIPKLIGQTVSILGALVIGTAAVQAGIVSAPMVIVVSLTGITSYVIPHNNLVNAIRLLRFPTLIMAGVLGLFGIMMVILLILIHLCSLRSFGTPYLTPVAPFKFSDWKDTYIRVPFWLMSKRSHLPTTKNQTRSKKLLRPKLPTEGEQD